MKAAAERPVGLMCAVAVVLLFSGFTVVSRLGFASSLALADIAALRFGIGGALLLPIVLRHGLSGLTWYQACALALLGGLGFALFAYSGFRLAPAAHGAVLLHGTLPLFTYMLTRALLRAPVAPAQRLGVVVIAAGLAMMALDSLLGAARLQLLGDAALLLASLCWSAYAILARRLGVAPAHAASLVAVISMVAFLPAYVAMPGKTLFLAPWPELLVQALFQGVLMGAVSIFVYTRAVAALGATETALFTAAVPCLTTLLAMPLLAEWPTPAGVAGVAVVTAGMMLAIRRPRRSLGRGAGS